MSTISAAFRTVAVMIGLLNTPVMAADQTAGDSLQSFIATYRCDIEERLALLHRRAEPPKGQNRRYIILSRADAQQDYVQCMFIVDGGAKVLCEAANGFFLTKENEPHVNILSTEEITRLAALGFDTTLTDGNYQSYTPIKDERSLKDIAALILSVMFQAYGAKTGTEMVVDGSYITPSPAHLRTCQATS